MNAKTGSAINMQPSIRAVVYLLIVLFGTGTGFCRNWDWDQKHEPVQGIFAIEGAFGWGKENYGDLLRGEYEPKDDCDLFCKIESVYVNTGQYQKKYTDLVVPGIGPALKITRTYNSQQWSSSLMGYGWTFNFGRKLIVSRNKMGEKQIGVLLDGGEKNYYREESNGKLTRLTDYGRDYKVIKVDDDTYRIKYANGTLYQLRHDGKIKKIIDRNGNEMRFKYDSVGCISRITNASGNYVDITLGTNGKIANLSDNLGRSLTYRYDGNGNLTAVTAPDNSTIGYEYNQKNYLVKITDASGAAKEKVTYDEHEPARVSCLTAKDNTYTFTYLDGKTEKTDANGNQWTYYYNDVGVIWKIVDPLGKEIRRRLNKISLISLDWQEDIAGNRTSYTYDAAGNMIKKTDPSGHTWQYQYSPDTNRLKAVINPLGGVTRLEYDRAGNLTATDFNPNRSEQRRWAFAYDAKGNLISMVDPQGVTQTYSYDKTGNLLTVTKNTAVKDITRFKYDRYGRIVKIMGPTGRATTLSYNDKAYRITKINAKKQLTIYLYDTDRRLIEVRYHAALKHTRPSKIITFSYDKNNNLTGYDDGITSAVYSYDNYHRKIKERIDYGPFKLENRYAYYANGMLKSYTGPDGESYHYRYCSGSGHRSPAVKKNGLQGVKKKNFPATSNNATYLYDLNGNIIKKKENGVTVCFYYNGEDRLVRVEKHGEKPIAEYYYDPFGRRLFKCSGNIKRYFHYNNWQLTGEYDASGRQLVVYGYLPENASDNGPLFLKKDGKYYWYHNDYNGATCKITSRNGALLWDAAYAAFGKVEIDQEKIKSNLGQDGRYVDLETGFHYGSNGYYIPELGRLLKSEAANVKKKVIFNSEAVCDAVNCFALSNRSLFKHIILLNKTANKRRSWEQAFFATQLLNGRINGWIFNPMSKDPAKFQLFAEMPAKDWLQNLLIYPDRTGKLP